MAGAANSRVIAAGVALAAIALLVGGAFAGLIAEGWRDAGSAGAAFDAYLWRLARFTLWQASLSTLLAIAPALLVARALTRQSSFPGRRLILQLFAVPLSLPAIVAALGLLALYGRAGLLAEPLSALTGSRWPGIYGLSGILIAHVFFNLPLATRLFVEALNTIPADQRRLATQLGLPAASQFRLIEWPVLRQALPGIAGLVFMLCVTSFTLVLILGGGPASTTLEVGIFQALRFDFDPPRAVALTLVQIVLTVGAVLVLTRLGTHVTGEANSSVAKRLFDRPGKLESAANFALIVGSVCFVLGPIGAVAIRGLDTDLLRLAGEEAVRRAALTSVALAVLAAALAIALTISLLGIGHGSDRAQGGLSKVVARVSESGASFVLVVPPVVIGAGWFILVRNAVDPLRLAPVMVVAVNGMMAMPFALRLLRPAYDDAALRHDRLCAQLGIQGLPKLRLVDWPTLRGPLSAAFAFAMALSLGDLGVIALFGSESVQTLPYLLLSRMGSYRTQDAAGLALMLGCLTMLLIVASDWLGKQR